MSTQSDFIRLIVGQTFLVLSRWIIQQKLAFTPQISASHRALINFHSIALIPSVIGLGRSGTVYETSMGIQISLEREFMGLQMNGGEEERNYDDCVETFRAIDKNAFSLPGEPSETPFCGSRLNPFGTRFNCRNKLFRQSLAGILLFPSPGVSMRKSERKLTGKLCF